MEIWKITISTLSVFVCASMCYGQMYSTTMYVRHLARIEHNLIDSLQNYIRRQENNGLTFDESIPQFLEDTNQTNRQLNSSLESSLDNAVSTFHLLRRAVGGWAELKEAMSCEGQDCPILTGEDVFKLVLKREKAVWPTEDDLKIAAKSIINIWNAYDIDLHSFANGTLMGVRVDPLSADDIFYIGSVAKDTGWFYEAITWFEHLRSELDGFSAVGFEVSTLYRRLAAAYYEYGMAWKAIELLENIAEKEPDNKGIARDLSYYRSPGGRSGAEKITVVTRHKATDDAKKSNKVLYEEMCRNATRGVYVPSSLSCYVRPLYGAYGEVREEVVSIRPRIVILHGVLNSTEIQLLRKYAEKSVLNADTSLTPSVLLSGSVCEFTPSYRLLVNLTQRLEQMTNTHLFPVEGVSSSECYQFTTIGVGYVGKLVDDAWEADKIPFFNTGNRLLTAQYQFSDVPLGGEIAFPKLGVVVPHVKGSIVLWENLKRDGTPNPKMKHINCPVIAGSYWSATKHVLYNNQAFRKPCDVTSVSKEVS